MIMNSSVYGCSADSIEIQRIIQYGIYPSKDIGIATSGERGCFLVVPAIFYPPSFFFQTLRRGGGEVLCQQSPVSLLLFFQGPLQGGGQPP